jgi:hypothetical protein
MKLKDLHIKFENTGMVGHDIITTAELKEYASKMEEIRELFKVWNPLIGSLSSQIQGAERMIEARKN